MGTRQWQGDISFGPETCIAASQLSALTGFRTTEIATFVHDGTLPKPKESGRHPLVASLQGLVKHQKQIARDARNPGNGDPDKARLIKARADIMEQEAQRRSGRLIDIDEAVKVLTGVYTNFRTRMLAVPTRAAPQVINEDAAGAHAILTDLIEEGLRELSTDELRAASANSGASRASRAPYIPAS